MKKGAKEKAKEALTKTIDAQFNQTMKPGRTNTKHPFMDGGQKPKNTGSPFTGKPKRDYQPKQSWA